MDQDHPSSAAGDAPQFSDHLLPALRAAAVLEIEMACDGEWGEDVHLETVRTAVHVLDALEDATATRDQVHALAVRAIAMQAEMTRYAVEANEPAWPTTLEESSGTLERLALTRDLIKLRDGTGG
jgi:imidazoleglycerol phosphate dehydratase HisB